MPRIACAARESIATKHGLVLLSPAIPWEYPLFQRQQQLALAFARDHEVVFIETGGEAGKPAFVEHEGRRVELFAFSKRGLRSPLRRLAAIAQGAVARGGGLVRALGGGTHFDLGLRDWLRFRLLGRRLETRAMAGSADFRLFLLQYPWSGSDVLIRRLRRKGVICAYDMLDDFAALDGGQGVVATERRIIGTADLVFATSRALEERARSLSRRVLRVPNAVDPTFFAPARGTMAKPDDWPFGDDRPVVGYAGALFEWLDVELVLAAARARRDWRFVLVGLARPEVARRLAGEPNLALLPARPLAELLSCLARFDVGIIPFRAGAVAAATNPVKVYEYLAAGKPVVATELAEVRDLPGVTVADGPRAFVDAIAIALATPLDLALVDGFLAANTWDDRVRAMLGAISSAR